jgi:predicted amidohydrolase YtcJ
MTPPADLVITGADVYCGDASRRWAHAVAVRGDRIVAVGSDEQVREHVGPGTMHRHLPGRMVTAGFQDSHIHPPFAGRNRMHVWLNDLVGREAYLEEIARYAAANPDEPWIIGGGWAMEYFPGGTPLATDLDAIVPDRPVFLFNRDVHGAWVNSRTLQIAGITGDTPDPVDGRIERDPRSGDPSGTLHEGAAYALNDRFVPLPDQRDWERALLNAQEYLHSLGITGWQDAWVTPGTLAAYRSLAQAGSLTARVVGALWWDRDRGLEQIPEFVQQRESGAAGSFHPTTVKIMTDGVMENYTGALLQPYCDGCGGHTDNSGLSFVDRDLLAAAVTELDRLGFPVHMHTIGDRAVRNALDAVQAAREANGPSDLRHHLAHLQVVQPDDVPRFRELDVVANCQPYWAQLEPQMSELTLPFLGEERAAMQYPFGDLLRAGAVLAMGSDWSVTTANVLEEIEVAVTRVDPENRDNPSFLPEQAISLQDAIAAFTSGSAYVNHDEDDAGSVQVGKRADLAVIDRNLFARDAGPVADARVLLTTASGRVVFEKPAESGVEPRAKDPAHAPPSSG